MAKASTDPQTWPIRRLRAAKKGFVDPDVRLRITIPSYQRGLVWPHEKKVALIESIHRGFPIGALLLSERETDTQGVRQYSLIDGLQRTNTIIEYLDRPLKFAVPAVLPETQLELLRQGLQRVLGAPAIDPTTMRNATLGWLHQTEVLESARGFEWTELLITLRRELSLPPADATQTEELRQLLAKLVDEIRAEVSIDGIGVPVLLYSGPAENLPDIFERLNSQGTSLTKYQILAASWVNDDTVISNVDVQDAIEKRYRDLERQGFLVERNEGGSGVQASLFEYLFGLSRVLVETFPRLFGRPAIGTDPSIAFLLATLIRGEQLSGLAELPNLMTDRDPENRILVAKLEDAIVFAVRFVDDALKPYLGLQLTSEPSAPAHSELQIISMVGAVAAHRYASTTDWAIRAGWANVEARLRSALPQHYLLDILRLAWRGPTYSLAFERVWKQKDVPSDAYLTPPADDTWENELKLWFENEELGDLTTKRPYTSSAEKVLLKFIYSSIVTVADQGNYQFDVEHLFPVARLVPFAQKAGGEGWPIGCISNLALLDRNTNRRKSDETIAEYFGRVGQKGGPTAQEVAAISPYILTAAAAVAIPSTNGQDDLTRADYEEFLRLRWETMKALLYARLGVNPSH